MEKLAIAAILVSALMLFGCIGAKVAPGGSELPPPLPDNSTIGPAGGAQPAAITANTTGASAAGELPPPPPS